MKMGKKILFLMSFIMVAILAACSDAKSSITLESVTDYSSAVINNDDKKITISVDNAVESFDLGKIKTKELVTIIAYSDSSRTMKIEGNLSVAEGDNTYYLKLSLKESKKDFSVNWVLVITRAKAATPEKTLSSIEINEFKYVYFINDEYTAGSIKLIYSDDSTETKAVAKEMISGFDTATIGKKAVEITYLGKKVSTNINVLGDSIADLQPSEISDEVLKPIFTFISAAKSAKQISGETFEADYKYIETNFPEERYQGVKEILQTIGFVDSEIEAFTLLVTNEYKDEISVLLNPILELYYFNSEAINVTGPTVAPSIRKIRLIMDLLAKTNAEFVCDISKDLISIVPTHKLAILLELMNYEENIYYVPAGDENKESLTADEYVAFLNEIGLETVAEFIAQSNISDPDAFKERFQMSYDTIELIKVLLNCDADIIVSVTESVNEILKIYLANEEEIRMAMKDIVVILKAMASEDPLQLLVMAEAMSKLTDFIIASQEDFNAAMAEIINVINQFGNLLSYLDEETSGFENYRYIIEQLIVSDNGITNYHLSEEQIAFANLLLDNADGIAKTMAEITKEEIATLSSLTLYFVQDELDYSSVIEVAKLITKLTTNFDTKFINTTLKFVLPKEIKPSSILLDIATISLMNPENLTDANKTTIDAFMKKMVGLLPSEPTGGISFEEFEVIFIPKDATKAQIAQIVSKYVEYYTYDEEGKEVTTAIQLTADNIISLDVTKEGIQSGVISYNDISQEFSCIVYDSTTEAKFVKSCDTLSDYILIIEKTKDNYVVDKAEFSLNYSYEGFYLGFSPSINYSSLEGTVRDFNYKYVVDLTLENNKFGHGYVEITHDVIGTFYLPFNYLVLHFPGEK